MGFDPNRNFNLASTDSYFKIISDKPSDKPKSSVDYLSDQINELNKDSINKNNEIFEFKEINEKQAKEIKDFEVKLLKLEKFFDTKLKTNIENATTQIKSIETKTLESLALFATLFTFISVNIQIFSKVENLGQAGIFTSLLAFALLTFLGLFFSRTRENWRFLVITLTVFFIFSLGFAFWGFSQPTLPNCLQTTIQDPQKCALTQEQIKKIISDDKK